MVEVAQQDVFRVALTADFYLDDGRPRYPSFDLVPLQNEPGIHVQPFAEHQIEISPSQVGHAQGVIVLTPKVTAKSVAACSNLLAIGRFGVGYDAVDVAACTQADVLVYITAGAADHSVAEATLSWMLALTHHVRLKDRLVREGRWDDRSRFMGCELRDRILGIIGLGGIGRALVKLTQSFGMRSPVAYDPLLTHDSTKGIGVKLTSLEELLATADFVSIHCPLNDHTSSLIGARELALMKPQAYLINTARGGIVDEDALYQSLSQGRIAGAAIDCFIGEPLTTPHRFGQLENVLLAPHCIAWTEELFRDIGAAACQGMIDLALGRRPLGVVNPDVLDRPTFHEKWRRLRLNRS